MRDLCTDAIVAEELLAYGETGFAADALAADREYPLPDEPFVEAWRTYADEAMRDGAGATLRRHFLQLQFPVVEGMHAREDYLTATRRGVIPRESNAPPFADESGLTISLHATAAGRIGVIVADHRADFQRIVRSFANHNEPAVVPTSMGACIIGGYNNWSRVARLREQWLAQHATQDDSAVSEAAWRAEFQRLMPRRELYQDRFIVASTGPYSATPAHTLGLSDDEWRRISLVIRVEHESAHYFTRRVFGSMRNALLDELIADYTGIVAARGAFEPEWLLRFMGVEHPTQWRADGRLANYRGTPPLSSAAFRVLQTIVRRAAATLARFDALWRDHARSMTGDTGPRSLSDVARIITAIASAGLERLSLDDFAHELFAAATTHLTSLPGIGPLTADPSRTDQERYLLRCSTA
ncbi:MAG TPA: hypothetical protein VN706_16055 [Gemmatimonadaceae bacterium]|nr:hypothetical protein [Gemmatimonadaceae bacterium]